MIHDLKSHKSKRTPTGAKDIKSLVSTIEEIAEEESLFRTALEQAWFINHINYMGFQWTLIDPLTGTIDEIPNEVRFRANGIQSRIHQTVAALTANPPGWDVDTDNDSVKMPGARNVAELFLEYVWDRQGMEIKHKELCFSARIYGTALLHPEWDPAAGKKLNPDDFFSGEGDDLFDVIDAFDGDQEAAIRFLEGEDELFEGDITITQLSPFDVHVDEAAYDVESARWCLITSVEGVDEVRERYGDAAKDLEPEPLGDGSGPSYKYRLRQLVSPNVVSGGTSQTHIKGAVEVYKYYERPSTKFPNGRLVIYANKNVLFYGENPYAHTSAEIPLVRYRDMVVPQRFWGMAAMEQAIPLQRAKNKAHSNIIQNEHDVANNKWLVPRGSGLKQGAIDRSSSEVIEYNPISMGTGTPLRPERIGPGRTSDLSLNTLQLCDEAMDDVMGTREVSKGIAPSGVSSGVALGLLKDADDSRNGLLRAELSDNHAKLGKMVLDIAKRFITEPRMFRSIVGEEREAQVIDFMGTDLDYRNVRVDMGSKTNKLLKQQALIEILQYGGIEMFDSMEARKALFQAAGVYSGAVVEESVHQKRAKYENKLIEQGQQPYVTDYQDHEQHLAVLEEWMNSLEFDKLPMNVQQLAHAHRAEHQMAIQQAMEAQQMAQMQQMSMMSAMGVAPPGASPVDTPDDEGQGN